MRSIYLIIISLILTNSVLADDSFVKLCKSGSLEQISEALKSGASVKDRDNEGSTPLMYAAAQQTEPKIIELLIKSGASVNDKNNDGETPLMRCAKYGKCPEIIMTLLKAKSNGKEKNLLGMTAFDLAQDNENIKGTEAYWELSNAR